MPSTSPTTFLPRARLMLLLGDQLIRDAGIAVFELVKNAYDADARKCTVKLGGVHEDSEDATVEIEDDGSGMDVGTVKHVWLAPGTRNRLTQREGKHKTNSARSPKFHRLPLGEKGVGRFAVHKLGNHVEMVTRAKGKAEVVVAIDWTDFDSDEPLSSIPVTVRTRKAQRFKGRQTGTYIKITDLRERPWRRRQVTMLHRAVTSICSPFDAPDKFVAKIILSPDPHRWLTGLLTPARAVKLAHFRFVGHLEKGQLTYDYEFNPGAKMDRVSERAVLKRCVPLPTKKEEQGKLKTLSDDSANDLDNNGPIDLGDYSIGRIEFDFRIFDRDRQTLSLTAGDSKTLTDFLDLNGGVRVYREGIRVYDFGELGNDWLDLGSRRINVPTRRIGNNQILGSIHLNLIESKDLIEKTNREGFVENRAYQVFRRAISFTIRQAEIERNIDKDRIRRAYAQARQKEPVLGDLAQLREEVELLKIEAPDTKRLVKYIDQIDSQYREVVDKLLAAAGAGLNLATVLHEVDKGIKTLYHSISHGERGDVVIEKAKHIADVVDSLTWLMRQSGRVNVSAAALIQNCLFAWGYRFEKHGIQVTNGIEAGNESFTVKCNRRLVMTALMNLIDNAIYWLGTKPRDRRLYVGATTEYSGKPALVVADNGPGLLDPPEYLTMAFFTRKQDGMGLGLHIASEIMKIQGGSVQFPSKGTMELPRGMNGAVILLEFGEQP